MAINLAELKIEVAENPLVIPGLSWGQTDVWIRDKLSELGASNQTIARESVETSDIMTALYSDVDGFMDITQLEVAKLNLLSPVGSIDPSVLQEVFLNIFPLGGVREPIRLALIALATRSCSRAEKLWGENPTITQVHIARRLP
jgi:hypothetical protein